MTRLMGLLLAAAMLVLAPRVATADPQAAQKLYDDGLKEMQEGNYAAGCPKLSDSYGLDPLPGALFTLSACYERWGKLKSAAEHYQQFLEKSAALPADQGAKQEARIKTAMDKVAQLRPQIPTVTLSFATPPDPSVSVTLNDVAVAADAYGQPQPMDPGAYRVVVTSATGETKEYSGQLAPSAAETVDLQVPGGGAPAPVTPDTDEPSEGGDGDLWRTTAFVVGGVGVAGLIVGAITGGLVFSKKGDVDDQCVDFVCTPEGKEAVDDAETLGLVSTVSFAVGGAAVAAGVLMYLLAPDDTGQEQAAHLRVLMVRET